MRFFRPPCPGSIIGIAVRPVLSAALIAMTAAVLLIACGPSATRYMAYQLTCCTQTDIERIWQPGTAVDLHWIATSSEVTTVNPSHRVVITGALSGPFADVSTLKQGKTAATNSVTGSTVTFDNRVPPAVNTVMSFDLPADLPAGLYNLSMAWDFGAGDSASAASVVRVGQQ